MKNGNFTNLGDTYLYGSPTKNINFYKYCKNNENSIDDPIFTGFTFDIDELHSPLFFTDSKYEDAVSDTLRSSGGTDTSLANIIENRLTEVYKYSITGSPNSYELSTISVKDMIDGMDRYAGYGLQDKYYMDNVLYGATDYIYMVDKVSIGQYSDEIGTTDVGNGSPDSGIYDTYANALLNEEISLTSSIDIESGNNILNDTDLPVTDSDTSIEERVSAEIERINNESDATMKAEHEENVSKKKDAQDAYDAVKEEYDELYKEIQSLENEVTGEISKANDELSEFQSTVNTLLEKIKNGTLAEEGINSITSTYDKFKEFIASKTSDSNKSDIGFNTVNNFDTEVSALEDSEKSLYDKCKTAFENAWEILKTKIIKKTSSADTQKDLTTKKSELQALSNKLYGTDKTQATATSDSLYGQLQSAKTTCQNDTYTQTQQQLNILEQARENEVDVINYQLYKGTKTTTTSNLQALPTIDAKGETESIESYNERLTAWQTEVDSIRNTRQTYEVPQTVYDMLGFITGMKKMTREYPYVMQTVSGLDEAYKKYFLMKDPYQGSGDDKITISCYESLDLRVSSMFNKYFNAVYDRQYKRERVPINLRRFCCSIFVHDIRNFRHSLSLMNSKFNETQNGDGVLSKLVEMALNYTSAIEFKFFDCEIIPEETGAIFDNVSNETGGEPQKTSFTFKYGNCVINFLPFEDLAKYYESQSNVTSTSSDIYYGKSVKKNLSDSSNMIRDLTSELNGDTTSSTTDTNFRRWFDKSVLGNVNNNDYRDYVRNSTSVEVDNIYKTSIVNNFALNSVTNKQQEVTQMNDALRKIVTGISASTGIPVKGVTDALNIGNIYDYINKGDGSDTQKITDLGNVDTPEVTVIKKNVDLGNITKDQLIPGAKVTGLGNISNESDSKGIVTDLKKINGDSSSKGTVTDLDKISGDSGSKGTVSGLGDATEDQQPIDLVIDLGKV